jgi:hypothetical protein
MGKSFIALLLCAACAAHGQQLLVEYQGTVSSIDRASSLAETPPYAIGDAIGGTLIIDTTFAPVDQLGGDSHWALLRRHLRGRFHLGSAEPRGRAWRRRSLARAQRLVAARGRRVGRWSHSRPFDGHGRKLRSAARARAAESPRPTFSQRLSNAVVRSRSGARYQPMGLHRAGIRRAVARSPFHTG